MARLALPLHFSRLFDSSSSSEVQKTLPASSSKSALISKLISFTVNTAFSIIFFFLRFVVEEGSVAATSSAGATSVGTSTAGAGSALISGALVSATGAGASGALTSATGAGAASGAGATAAGASTGATSALASSTFASTAFVASSALASTAGFCSATAAFASAVVFAAS